MLFMVLLSGIVVAGVFVVGSRALCRLWSFTFNISWWPKRICVYVCIYIIYAHKGCKRLYFITIAANHIHLLCVECSKSEREAEVQSALFVSGTMHCELKCVVR